MECRICKTECTGQTCSGACRAKLSRRTRTVAHAHVIDEITSARAQADGQDLSDRIDGDATDGQPPCTPEQMTSPCHACADHDTCSYRKNQTTAVPGDADYVGVA